MALTFHQKVKEIVEVGDKLFEEGVISEWELNFISDVSDRGVPSPTAKQKDIVDRIYEKVCDSAF